MSRRFYNCKKVVIPTGLGNNCPAKNDNCLECEYRLKVGTLGDNVWVDCGYYDMVDDTEDE